jgi:hypothetical protein
VLQEQLGAKVVFGMSYGYLDPGLPYVREEKR